MPPLNYTTTVPADRTVGECQSILARSGAHAVQTTYANRRASGLGFTLDTPHGQRFFTLPVNVEAMQARLEQAHADGEFRRSKQGRAHFTSREHAERVAWRVTKDWLEANLALIDAEMATLDQVMLPYLRVPTLDGDRTLYEAYRASEQATLDRGSVPALEDARSDR